MSFIYAVTGRSSTGKDSICKRLLEIDDSLVSLVPYTTRPMREGETDGREYYFRNEEFYQSELANGRIIEERHYDTINGLWRYFTVNDNQLQNIPVNKDIVVVASLYQVKLYQDYFGKDVVIPVYIDLDDYILLSRSLQREKRNPTPNIVELCRRFISDKNDFSEELKKEVGVNKVFWNNGDLRDTVFEIQKYINDIRKIKTA